MAKILLSYEIDVEVDDLPRFERLFSNIVERNHEQNKHRLFTWLDEAHQLVGGQVRYDVHRPVISARLKELRKS